MRHFTTNQLVVDAEPEPPRLGPYRVIAVPGACHYVLSQTQGSRTVGQDHLLGPAHAPLLAGLALTAGQAFRIAAGLRLIELAPDVVTLIPGAHMHLAREILGALRFARDMSVDMPAGAPQERPLAGVESEYR